jgi:hypothetical protein
VAAWGREVLGEAAYLREWSAGAALTHSEAIEVAIAALD